MPEIKIFERVFITFLSLFDNLFTSSSFCSCTLLFFLLHLQQRFSCSPFSLHIKPMSSTKKEKAFFVMVILESQLILKDECFYGNTREQGTMCFCIFTICVISIIMIPNLLLMYFPLSDIIILA